MFIQGGVDSLSERIKDHIDPLSPGHLCSRYKVAIADDEHDLVDETFISQRRNVQAQAHVYAFLNSVDLKVIIGEHFKLAFTIEQFLQYIPFQPPGSGVKEMAHPHCKLPFLEELGSKVIAKRSEWRLGIDRLPRDGKMHFLRKRRAIVEEDPM